MEGDENLTEGRVLVVDDDDDLRRLLESLFTLGGFDTRSVGDGDSAIAETRVFRPDVVILDIMLPSVDGFEVLRRIREDPDTEGTLVVMLTALGSDEDVWRGWQAGADSYVTKPFDIDDLLRIVRRLLEEGSGLSVGGAT